MQMFSRSELLDWPKAYRCIVSGICKGGMEGSRCDSSVVVCLSITTTFSLTRTFISIASSGVCGCVLDAPLLAS